MAVRVAVENRRRRTATMDASQRRYDPRCRATMRPLNNSVT